MKRCREDGPKVTQTQKEALRSFRKGMSMLIHGPGGTGKSFLIRIMQAEALGLIVLASTGTAASAFEGARTIHAFLRGVYDTDNFEKSLEKLFSIRSLMDEARGVRTIILDEVSMVDGRLLLLLHFVLCKAKQDHTRPFGGAQLVLVGDFFQLPPVFKNDDPWKDSFAFYAFNAIGFVPDVFELTQVVRQSETTFAEALCAARKGRVTDAHLDLLNSCLGKEEAPTATVIMYRRKAVLSHNTKRLLEEPDAGDTTRVRLTSFWFMGEVQGRKVLPLKGPPTMEARNAARRFFSDNARTLLVRTGSQIIFQHNIGKAVTNGTRGEVVGWVEYNPQLGRSSLVGIGPEQECHQKDPTNLQRPVQVVKLASGSMLVVHHHTVIVHLRNGRTAVVFRTVPFSMAWAISAHRAQGLSLDNVVVFNDCKERMPPACMYIMLSRCRSLKGLRIRGDPLTRRSFFVHPVIRRHFLQNDRTADEEMEKRFSELVESTLQRFF